MVYFVLRSIVLILHSYFAFVIELLFELMCALNISIVMDSVLLFIYIVDISIVTSKMSLLPSVVGKLHHSNCNV